MKLEQAIKYMRQGLYVTYEDWSSHRYVFMSDNGVLLDEDGDPLDLSSYEVFDEDWKIYEKPVTFVEALEAAFKGYPIRGTYGRAPWYQLDEDTGHLRVKEGSALSLTRYTYEQSWIVGPKEES